MRGFALKSGTLPGHKLMIPNVSQDGRFGNTAWWKVLGQIPDFSAIFTLRLLAPLRSELPEALRL